jgi:hypothetical protein
LYRVCSAHRFVRVVGKHMILELDGTPISAVLADRLLIPDPSMCRDLFGLEIGKIMEKTGTFPFNNIPMQVPDIPSAHAACLELILAMAEAYPSENLFNAYLWYLGIPARAVSKLRLKLDALRDKQVSCDNYSIVGYGQKGTGKTVAMAGLCNIMMLPGGNVVCSKCLQGTAFLLPVVCSPAGPYARCHSQSCLHSLMF